MAELVDIMNALLVRINTATAALSAAGNPRSIYKGWPSRNQLLKHMQAGWTDISVYLPPGLSRDMTKYPSVPFMLVCPTTDAYVDSTDVEEVEKRIIAGGSDITFTIGSDSGTFVPGENVVIKFKRYEVMTVDQAAVHTVVLGDTAGVIATDLASKIDALSITGVTAVAAGAVVTVSMAVVGGNIREYEIVVGRAGAKAVLVSEVKRQQRSLWVNIWAPSPTKRDAFMSALNADFGLFIEGTKFNRITLADGSTVIMFSSDPFMSDEEQREKIFRATFTLDAEYPTLVEVDATEIVTTQPQLTVLFPPGVTGGPGGSVFPEMRFCQWSDPFIEAQLEQLLIFNTGCD